MDFEIKPYPSELIAISEVAQRMNIHPQTLKKYITRHRIAVYKPLGEKQHSIAKDIADVLITSPALVQEKD